MDVRDDTTTSDGSLDQSVKLFVTSDGEEQVSWRDSLHLKVLGGVTGQLQDLGSEVFEDGSAVDGRSGTDSAVGTHSRFQESMDSSDGEL